MIESLPEPPLTFSMVDLTKSFQVLAVGSHSVDVDEERVRISGSSQRCIRSRPLRRSRRRRSWQTLSGESQPLPGPPTYVSLPSRLLIEAPGSVESEWVSFPSPSVIAFVSTATPAQCTFFADDGGAASAGSDDVDDIGREPAAGAIRRDREIVRLARGGNVVQPPDEGDRRDARGRRTRSGDGAGRTPPSHDQHEDERSPPEPHRPDGRTPSL